MKTTVTERAGVCTVTYLSPNMKTMGVYVHKLICSSGNDGLEVEIWNSEEPEEVM